MFLHIRASATSSLCEEDFQMRNANWKTTRTTSTRQNDKMTTTQATSNPVRLSKRLRQGGPSGSSSMVEWAEGISLPLWLLCSNYPSSLPTSGSCNKKQKSVYLRITFEEQNAYAVHLKFLYKTSLIDIFHLSLKVPG